MDAGKATLLIYIVVGAQVLGSTISLAQDNSVAETKRYKALTRIVDHNTGFAHMTRGVNVCTVLALRDQVTEADIPLLQTMLADDDRVLRRAALYTLGVMGTPGIAAIRTGGQRLDPLDVEDVIRNAREQEASLERYRRDKRCRAR